MEKIIDWVKLWNDLAHIQYCSYASDKTLDKPDHWRSRAKEFDGHVRRRWAQSDSSRELIISMLDGRPGATVLDIGAGTGAWAALMARHANRVTAVEPSSAMLELLRQHLESEKLTNVQVVGEPWPQAKVEAHDFTLCSHSMYGFEDFAQFIQSIERVTRHTCILLIRAPMMDGVMAQAAHRVWGHPYDSPNFQVALNALIQMGRFPNVVMEEPGSWEPWVNASLEEARDQIKRRLGICGSSEHDKYLMDLVTRRLTREQGQYVWPRAMKTALLYWRVTRSD